MFVNMSFHIFHANRKVCFKLKRTMNSLQGGEEVELIPGGNDIEVNAQNVHDYVRRYAEFRMTKVLDKALKVISIFYSLLIDKQPESGFKFIILYLIFKFY